MHMSAIVLQEYLVYSSKLHWLDLHVSIGNWAQRVLKCIWTSSQDVILTLAFCHNYIHCLPKYLQCQKLLWKIRSECTLRQCRKKKTLFYRRTADGPSTRAGRLGFYFLFVVTKLTQKRQKFLKKSKIFKEKF